MKRAKKATNVHKKDAKLKIEKRNYAKSVKVRTILDKSKRIQKKKGTKKPEKKIKKKFSQLRQKLKAMITPKKNKVVDKK